MEETYDVVVLGGGPAGSTVATFLAQPGKKILLLEKERFPRYHIGESLIPALWTVLDELGAKEKIERALFSKKAGATIQWGKQKEPWQILFRDYRRYISPIALHVNRGIFDQILLDHSRERGVEVRQGMWCQDVILGKDDRVEGVVFTDNRGSRRKVRARYVVDATGQYGLLARKFQLRQYDDRFKNIAVWAYFKGGKQYKGDEYGNLTTTVTSIQDGWIWHIPLLDSNESEDLARQQYLNSVGVVTDAKRLARRRNSLSEFLMMSLKESPLISDMLSTAKKVGQVRCIKDYSYKVSQFFGPGFILIGDAATFVDPLWSTGVSLSMFDAYFASIAIENSWENESMEGYFFDWYAKKSLKSYENARAIALHHYESASDVNTSFWKAKQLCFDSDDLPEEEAFTKLLSGHFSMVKELNQERGIELSDPQTQMKYNGIWKSIMVDTIVSLHPSVQSEARHQLGENGKLALRQTLDFGSKEILLSEREYEVVRLIEKKPTFGDIISQIRTRGMLELNDIFVRDVVALLALDGFVILGESDGIPCGNTSPDIILARTEGNQETAENGERKQKTYIEFSVELNDYLEALQNRVADSWESLVRSDNFRDKYVQYLIQTYHYIKYSVPLMALCCSKLDYKYKPIIEYLGHHISEEVGHDNWVLNDLENLGNRRDIVKNVLPLRTTVSLVGSQFYIINEIHPIGFLGYIYALESKPWNVGYINYLSEKFDIPLEAMSTLMGHAKEDPAHIQYLVEILNSKSIDMDMRQLILYNAEITLKNSSDFINAIASMDMVKQIKTVRDLLLPSAAALFQ